MSVIKANRGEQKLEVVTKARDLAVYTIKITSNEKVFIKEFQEPITNDLIKTSKDIFLHLYEANNCSLKNEFELRESLIRQSIRDCYNLLALMQIAKPLFHLSSKRLRYWANITIEVRNMARKLRDSDINRASKL